MRVVMLIETYPPEFTGAGRQLEALLPHIQAAGVETCVLTSHTGRRIEHEGPDNARIIRLPVRSDERRAHGFAIQAARWLFKNRGVWDLLHIHGVTRAAMVSLLLAKWLKKPAICKFTLMGSDDAATIRAARFGGFKTRLLATATRLIATSTALEQAAHSTLPNTNRVVRIPNGVDTDRFRPLPELQRAVIRQELCRAADWPDDAAVVSFLGFIEPRKGLDTLLGAWGEVAARHSGARLMIAGPSPAGDRSHIRALKAYAATHGLRGSVHFADYVPEPERILQGSTAFVFPSLSEGMPNALLEALAAGLPIAASDLPGITRDIIVPGESGLVFPPGDATACAEAICELLNDADRRAALGQAARNRALAAFALTAVAAQYAALYNELCGRRQPAGTP